MHILLFILIFIIAIFVFGLSIVGFILRTIFGIGRRSSARSEQAAPGTQSQRTKTYSTNDDNEEVYPESASEKKHKKIFTKEDGEYVDFEEIKE